MLTITVNTFENIDTKFHNDQRKTVGDMYICYRGEGLTFVELFSYCKTFKRAQELPTIVKWCHSRPDGAAIFFSCKTEMSALLLPWQYSRLWYAICFSVAKLKCLVVKCCHYSQARGLRGACFEHRNRTAPQCSAPQPHRTAKTWHCTAPHRSHLEPHRTAPQ